MNAEQLLAHFDRLAEAPDAVPRLRSLVLELAIRGKLVVQDDKDEPASVQLRDIQVARALRVGESKPRLRKASAQNDTNNLPFPLPRGWSVAPLAELTDVLNGRAYAKNELLDVGTPVLRVGNLFTSKHWYYSNLALEEDKYCYEGDLIFSWSASFGAFIWTGPKVIYHYHIWKLRLHSETRLDKHYLYRFLLQQTQQIKNSGHGVSMVHMTKEKMEKLQVPLPPLAEQHRIVAKVDELMVLCDQLEAAQQERERRRDRLAAASLQRLNQPADATAPDIQREHARFHLHHLPRLTTRPEHIKALRQTFLNLAVRGKLVEQVASDEPAADLLKRLQADIKLYGTRSRVQPAAVNAIAAEAVPYVVPSGWLWARLASLCRVVTDGDHLPPPKSDEGVAFLTIGNVSSGRLDFANSRCVPQVYFDKITPYRRPEIGDLLYTVVGASYGRPVLVETDRPFCVQRHIAILKPAAELQLKYLHLLLRSPFVYDQATGSLTGTAQPTIPLRPLRNFLVPLPPLAEQHRIVAKVDELMALCDQLEAQLTTTQTDSRRLLDAVLQDAVVN